MGLEVGKVRLEKYDPNWKNVFLEEKKFLKSIFKDLAIKIEHIGSTSIEEISAKPIIDIAVGIQNLSDFENVKHEFSSNELYSIKEDSACDEILIRKGPESNRICFIHVMEINSERYKDSILFRDYLISHEDAKFEYEKLKIDLANKFSNDRKEYTKAKNSFIQDILNKAKNNL